LRYLTEPEVLELHRLAVERYGGASGLRRRAILSGAVGAARASFGGAILHPDPVFLAAAYAFYIVKDHPFLDGNKRTALAACDAALQLNGHEVPSERESEFERHIWGLASGTVGKADFTEWL
jgi:death-on-curing protein